MRKSDNQIREDWNEIESGNVERAISMLRQYEQDIRQYIAECVAATCNVTVSEMFDCKDVVYYAHARWLYWYAYRYMTNESYEKIAIDTQCFGHAFVKRSIQGGVTKMMTMIEREPIWQKRWSIIKRIIALRNSQDNKLDNTIVIQVPKDIQDKIKIEVKTK